jgi:hypothetical protein
MRKTPSISHRRVPAVLQSHDSDCKHAPVARQRYRSLYSLVGSDRRPSVASHANARCRMGEFSAASPKATQALSQSVQCNAAYRPVARHALRMCHALWRLRSATAQCALFSTVQTDHFDRSLAATVARPYAAWMPRKSLQGRTCGASHDGVQATALQRISRSAALQHGLPTGYDCGVEPRVDVMTQSALPAPLLLYS